MNSRKFAVASSAPRTGVRASGRPDAAFRSVIADSLAASGARIPCKRLRLASSRLPENFLLAGSGLSSCLDLVRAHRKHELSVCKAPTTTLGEIKDEEKHRLTSSV